MTAAIETTHVESNGLRFAVDCFGAGSGLALYLHGFPESRFSWRHQLPMRSEQGFTSGAPDMRGYGDSDRPPGVAAYKMPNLLADVAGLIDAARRRGKSGPVTLIGHDWGGAIAGMFRGMAVDKSRFLCAVLKVPTLMIGGKRDSALGIELTDGTLALVRDFRLHYLPGVSHWVQQEAPEAVNMIMVQWLATHGS